jgi:hypothetical protein
MNRHKPPAIQVTPYENVPTRHRLSCDISAATKDRLEKLLESMDALTTTEVIRRIAELADIMYEAKNNGRTIVLMSRDGTKTNLLLI